MNRILLLAAILGIGATIAYLTLALILAGGPRPERTLGLYAEDLRFNSTNPPITVKAGETIRLILINKDTVVHNFKVRGLIVNSKQIVREGEKDEIILTAGKPGEYTYICTNHPVIMDGMLVVQR